MALSSFYTRHLGVYVNPPLTPALHLALWCLGVNKRSPTRFGAAGSVGSQHRDLYSMDGDQESLGEQVGVCRGINLPRPDTGACR